MLLSTLGGMFLVKTATCYKIVGLLYLSREHISLRAENFGRTYQASKVPNIFIIEDIINFSRDI